MLHVFRGLGNQGSPYPYMRLAPVSSRWRHRGRASRSIRPDSILDCLAGRIAPKYIALSLQDGSVMIDGPRGSPGDVRSLRGAHGGLLTLLTLSLLQNVSITSPTSTPHGAYL